MSIIDNFKPFIDRFGLVSPNGQPTGNGIRYTAEYCVALSNQELTISEEVIETLRIVTVLNTCKKERGLYNRAPGCTDLEAPDDYIGLGTISSVLNKCIAKDILDYGRTHKCFGIIPYVYNNVEPGKWNSGAFLGRQQQVICHLQFAAGEEPPLWRKLWWCAAIYMSANAPVEDQDAYVLAWHLVKVAEGKSKICDMTIKYWREKTKDRIIGDVLGDYFGNHEHPLVKYLRY